ncbi:MAG: hypothetical protein D4S01_10470 [Dehalococcoidia bacterium]|nr:MAG: hypothetical protein D4S01_10470 [Dehalococcoidia bacterium]
MKERELVEMEKKDPDKYFKYDNYIAEVQENPLAFTLPHGRPRRNVGNDGIAFMNNYDDDFILVTAGNQFGKTYGGAGYIGLRICPTDKNWLCFTHHKLKWKPFTGAKKCIVASYSWDNVKTAWETYQKVLPRKELGRFAPNYGLHKGEVGKARNLSFGDGKPKVIHLACGSEITFLCYTQSLVHWEGRQCDIAHLDEQCPEDKFDALTARMITRGSYTPIIATLTGHVVDGRPDTGSGSWIKTQIVDGRSTKGRKIAQYKIALEDVPDVIISKETKKRMYVQWVEEPRKNNNERKLREADARYWGGWEVGGGVVLCEWNPLLHFIEPFDLTRYQPTYYRLIDHGQNPCAAAIFAVMPWGQAVIIKEYYEFGLVISENARKITIEMCGNTIDDVDDFGEPIEQEVMSGMEFYSSEMDCRSFGKKSDESHKSIGTLYNEHGLSCIPATGQHNDILIPLLKQALSIQKGKKHLNEHLCREWEDDLKNLGGADLYVFNTCTNLKAEIEGYVYNIKTGKPVDKDDHLISTLRWFCSQERPYLGDYNINDCYRHEEPVVVQTKYTNY